MTDVGSFRKLRPEEWTRLSGTNLGAQMIKNGVRFIIEPSNYYTVVQERHDELYAWCDENIVGLYYLLSVTEGQTAYFEYEEDAVAFKLMWI